MSLRCSSIGAVTVLRIVFVWLVVVLPEAGRLMARYCVAFDTMKQFNSVEGHETLAELVGTMGRRF